MEFQILFDGDAVRIESRALGLNFLDRVREETEIPDLDPELVGDRVHAVDTKYPSTVSEEVARRSGLFWESWNVRLRVRNFALNQFFELGMKVSKNGRTGEITHVSPVWEFDESSFLSWWEDEGFPLEIGGED